MLYQDKFCYIIPRIMLLHAASRYIMLYHATPILVMLHHDT